MPGKLFEPSELVDAGASFSSWKPLALFTVCLLVASFATADSPGRHDSWRDVASHGESLVFGRFEGKFSSTEFHSRRVRLREVRTGKKETLEIDEGLGYITEYVPPGLYDVVGFEAVYYPHVRPFKPEKYRPIRQRFGLSPKTGDASTALILVPEDRPVYIGTISASNAPDGVVYKGHRLRVLDEYQEAYARLSSFYPKLTQSLESDGIVPARHFMLKPTRPPEPLDRVVGVEDPIAQAREYIADGKYKQAMSWLETFMPASDTERTEVQLLVGEALLGDRRYPEAIEELGEVLLIDSTQTRALRLLARAHALDGDLEDAQNLYEALAEAIPDDAEAHLHLGYLYALQHKTAAAEEQFSAAFQTDFDYLLNDYVPFFVALKQAMSGDSAKYVPPRIRKFKVPPPKGMDSRRQSKNSGFAVLVDHEGKVLACQIASHSSGSTPLMMLSFVRATYEPASLNGTPVPAVVLMGGPGAGKK